MCRRNLVAIRDPKDHSGGEPRLRVIITPHVRVNRPKPSEVLAILVRRTGHVIKEYECLFFPQWAESRRSALIKRLVDKTTMLAKTRTTWIQID